MNALAITSAHAIPRGATVLERSSIRIADAVARWATARAERRQNRHEALIRSIHAEQTRRADPRAADHLLAQMGMPVR